MGLISELLEWLGFSRARATRKVPILGVEASGKSSLIFTLAQYVSALKLGKVPMELGGLHVVDLLSKVAAAEPLPPTMNYQDFSLDLAQIPETDGRRSDVDLLISSEDIPGQDFRQLVDEGVGGEQVPGEHDDAPAIQRQPLCVRGAGEGDRVGGGVLAEAGRDVGQAGAGGLDEFDQLGQRADAGRLTRARAGSRDDRRRLVGLRELGERRDFDDRVEAAEQRLVDRAGAEVGGGVHRRDDDLEVWQRLAHEAPLEDHLKELALHRRVGAADLVDEDQPRAPGGQRRIDVAGDALGQRGRVDEAQHVLERRLGGVEAPEAQAERSGEAPGEHRLAGAVAADQQERAPADQDDQQRQLQPPPAVQAEVGGKSGVRRHEGLHRGQARGCSKGGGSGAGEPLDARAGTQRRSSNVLRYPTRGGPLLMWIARPWPSISPVDGSFAPGAKFAAID